MWPLVARSNSGGGAIFEFVGLANFDDLAIDHVDRLVSVILANYFLIFFFYFFDL